MSSLVSGNNVNISSNQDINVLASVITGDGDGNISANNDINIQALQNLYYNYYFHQETQMDMGALALQIAIAVAVSVATAGAGAVLMGVVLTSSMASIATSTAIAVGTQYAISGNTEQIQSGSADSTTTTSRTLITSSLLFGGNLNLNAGNNANILTANIKADNIDQDVKQSSTTSFTQTHTDIKPDYGKIAEGAAITGAIAGGAVVAGEYISQVKADYNKSITPEQTKLGKTPVSEGNSSIFDQNTPNSGYSNSKLGINVTEMNSKWYIEGTPTQATWSETYVTGSQNPAFKALNTTPGAPSFVDFHDALNLPTGINQLTIAPAYALSQCAAMPVICAAAPDTFINIGTWGRVSTNLDDVVTSSSQSGSTTTNSVLFSN